MANTIKSTRKQEIEAQKNVSRVTPDIASIMISGMDLYVTDALGNGITLNADTLPGILKRAAKIFKGNRHLK